jgi:hypothetical protein
MIYANADDPAVWVETRYGLGWTLNFGRPMSYLLLALLLSPAFAGVGFAFYAAQQNAHHLIATNKIDFVADPDLVGQWVSVDFVEEIDDFDPDKQTWQGDLYLKRLDIASNGTIRNTGYIWTKGQISHGPGDKRPANYIIKKIEGHTYLFMQWISGDVTIRKMKPRYYVLRKETP